MPATSAGGSGVAAYTIGDLIETGAARSESPASSAYTLIGIEIRNELGHTPSVVYHLASNQEDSRVETITVERSKTANVGMVNLFDRADATDTFYRHAGNSARTIHMANGGEAQGAVARDILDAYQAIKAQGISIAPDLRLISRAEGKFALADELTDFLQTLPFTGELTADFMAEERERQRTLAEQQAQQEQARRLAEQQAIVQREAQHAAERAAEARAKAYLATAEANADTVRQQDTNLQEAWTKALEGLSPEAQELLQERVAGIASRVINFGNPPKKYDMLDAPFSTLRGFVEIDRDTGDISYFAGANDDDPQGVTRLVRSRNLPLWNGSQFTSIQPEQIEAGTQVSAANSKTGASVTFEPAVAIRLTEQSAEQEEVTTIYFSAADRGGIVLQCQSGTMTYVTYGQMKAPNFYFAPGMRKPVIYLYPKKRTEAQVTVRLTDAHFTNTYPQIDGDTWHVVASPNGTLSAGGKKYKYLFWDGSPTREVQWDWSQGFSVHRDNVDIFLEEKTQLLGLNFAEVQDFITYWSPLVKQNEWSFVAFQTERYEELARLMVDPKPESLIRVYMVFKQISEKLDVPEQKLKKLTRKGFTVVEWGGSNADELSRALADSASSVRK